MKVSDLAVNALLHLAHTLHLSYYIPMRYDISHHNLHILSVAETPVMRIR